MKRLALIAMTVCVGLALWAGLVSSQDDPWWHPINPAGQSAGVSYGTNLPTLANTGSQPSDGLLAVQITAGSVPTLNMYDETSAGFIPFVVSDGLVPDIDQGITALVTFEPTLAANDNNNDQRNVLLIDVDVPNGTGGLVNGINFDAVTDDGNSIESALFVEAGWDAAIMFADTGAASTNALADSVMMFLSDATDYDGGANDCAVVFRDAGGNEGSVVVLSNNPCP